MANFDVDFEDIKYETQPENEWAVSYSDVISLLLVFFVLLISTSQVNSERFEQIKNIMEGNSEVMTSAQEIKDHIQKLLNKNKLQGAVEVKLDEMGVTIRIKDKLLFESGKAGITPGAKRIIAPILESFRGLPPYYRFEIEGHTDDVPIRTEKFPSNWYLSSGRALSILDMFLERGFSDERFKVYGFADQKPLVPNFDQAGNPIFENRLRNRRVEIKVR